MIVSEKWQEVCFGRESIASLVTSTEPSSEERLKPKTKKKRLGIKYSRAIQHEYCLNLASLQKTVKIEQDSAHACLGAVIWDCAFVICSLLEKFNSSSNIFHLKGKQVLEFGSGTGVVGLAAAALGAARVVLTDQHSLCGLLERNVEKNDAKSIVSVKPYLWGSEDPTLSNVHFDLILCSDLLYDPKVYNDLIASIEMLVKEETMVIFSYKSRFAEREEGFFLNLEKKLEVKLKTIVLENVEEADDGVHILFFQKKAKELKEPTVT